MSSDPLADLRAGLAQCEIILFADMGARTVLAWDAAVKWPQEQLDTLCALASAALEIGTDEGGYGAIAAVVARPDGTHLFARATPDADEALCAVFAPNTPLDGVLPVFQEVCMALADEGAAPVDAATF